MFPDAPSIPDTVCTAMAKLAVENVIKSLNKDIERIKDRQKRNPLFSSFFEQNLRRLESEAKELEEIPINHINPRWAIDQITPDQKDDIARQSGVLLNYTSSTLPACESRVEVKNAISAIKRKLEAGGHKATCTATDDRINEFEAPSVQAIRKAQSCNTREF